MSPHFWLMLASFVCFVVGAFIPAVRGVNLVSAGLALWSFTVVLGIAGR